MAGADDILRASRENAKAVRKARGKYLIPKPKPKQRKPRSKKLTFEERMKRAGWY